MLLDLLFPKRCLGCGKWGNYFCQDCLKSCLPLEKQICPVCRKSSISNKAHAKCQTRYSLDGLTSIFPYQGLIKKAVTKLKYKFITDLAQELMATMIHIIVVEKDFAFLGRLKPGILVPVPLHPRRERQRGFNQAELLGRPLAKELGWQVQTDLLKRHQYTKPQVRLQGKARRQNIKGAFQVNQNFRSMAFCSKLIVFDDVWTTGSTLRECGSVLKRAGAKKVWGLTLAR